MLCYLIITETRFTHLRLGNIDLNLNVNEIRSLINRNSIDINNIPSAPVIKYFLLCLVTNGLKPFYRLTPITIISDLPISHFTRTLPHNVSMTNGIPEPGRK